MSDLQLAILSAVPGDSKNHFAHVYDLYIRFGISKGDEFDEAIEYLVAQGCMVLRKNVSGGMVLLQRTEKGNKGVSNDPK